MKLYNSLTKNTDDFTPQNNQISIYTCGPTVYNNLHIGNLSAFIYADLLRRVLGDAFSCQVKHVMNITDVDDKTIRDSSGTNSDPMNALLTLTRKYEQVFMEDMSRIGNDMKAFSFIRATDSIEEMLNLIRELYQSDIAYITEDGVYFSIEKYTQKGKVYGQLVDVTTEQVALSRIANDEYDKDSARDFALWKVIKDGEPSWGFELDGKDLTGRPGWHIECSAMSRKLLGEQFDIHTGGIDLKFPHHENEIAQSTAIGDNNTMARFFVHNEHILVDGTKMSKSLGNFYTLRDVEAKGFDPLVFRLVVLQGHYRNSVNFTWDSLTAAQNRLHRWKEVAALRWQANSPDETSNVKEIDNLAESIRHELQDDLSTPRAIMKADIIFDLITQHGGGSETMSAFKRALIFLDKVLGMELINSTPDITDKTRVLLSKRSYARDSKDWAMSDELRDELKRHGVNVRDADNRQIWSYATSVIDSEYFCL